MSVQALLPDGLGPVFWQSRFVAHGRLGLARIQPGRYRLQRFEPQHFAGTWGLLGPALGEPVEIEVGADGKVTPARVF